MGFNTIIMILIFNVYIFSVLSAALIFSLYKLRRSRLENRRMRRRIDRLRLSNSKLSRYVDLDDLTRSAIAPVPRGADRPP